jgi:hypothetical protein
VLAYKNKKFKKWQFENNIKNIQLLEIVDEINNAPKKGKIGQFYKKRIKIEGAGKSGGYRVIIAAKIGINYFFMYGFKKNEKSTLDTREEKLFKEMAEQYLSYTEKELIALVDNKMFEIVQIGEDNE